MAVLGKLEAKGHDTGRCYQPCLDLHSWLEMRPRSCEGMKGESHQQIGKILGENISVQEYQKLFDEYQSAIKFTMQRDNLSEQELNQVKDQVWQQLVSSRVLEADAKKVGLTVTEKEIENVLSEGTNQC